jgi:hypothetical protein
MCVCGEGGVGGGRLRTFKGSLVGMGHCVWEHAVKSHARYSQEAPMNATEKEHALKRSRSGRRGVGYRGTVRVQCVAREGCAYALGTRNAGAPYPVRGCGVEDRLRGPPARAGVEDMGRPTVE